MIHVNRLVGRIAVCAFLVLPSLPAAAIVNFDVNATVTTSQGGIGLSAEGGQANINFFKQDVTGLFCNPTGVNRLPLVSMVTYAGTERTFKNVFNGSYTIEVKILDNDQGGSASATFTGTITGYMSQGESSLTNTFSAPSTRAVVLNGTTYTITIGPFIAPGAPISSVNGLIGATVTCAPTGTGVASVTLPASPKAGQAVPGTVTLNGPAPVGGAVVSLTSGSATALDLPASVIIPEGATSAAFYGSAKEAASNVAVEAKWNNTTISKTVSVGAASGGGDTNDDGQITIIDVARWLRVASGLDTMPG